MSQIFGGVFKTTIEGRINGRFSKWKDIWENQSMAGVRGVFNGERINVTNYEDSFYNKFAELKLNGSSLTKKLRPIIIYHIPDEMIKTKKFFWFLINCGKCLTLTKFNCSSVYAVIMNSLANVFAQYAMLQNEENLKNLKSTIKWTSTVMNILYYRKSVISGEDLSEITDFDSDFDVIEIINNNNIKNIDKIIENFDFYIKTFNTNNVLYQLSLLSILSIIKKHEADKHQLLNYVMISLSRTYHDTNDFIGKLESQERLRIIMFTIKMIVYGDINVAKDEMEKDMRETLMYYYHDFDEDKINHSIISTFIKSIYMDNITKPDIIILAKICWNKMKEYKIRDLRIEYIEDKLPLHTIIMKNTPFEIKKTKFTQLYNWNVYNSNLDVEHTTNSEVTVFNTYSSSTGRYLTYWRPSVLSSRRQSTYYVYGNVEIGNELYAFNSNQINLTYPRRGYYKYTTDIYSEEDNETDEERLLFVICCNNREMIIINYDEDIRVRSRYYRGNNICILTSYSKLRITDETNYYE